jgi:hypothetical protein
MKKYLLILLFVNNLAFGQTYVQAGFSGTSVRNTNSNSTVLPFTPSLNYELSAGIQNKFTSKLGYRLEAGYNNKGGVQGNAFGIKSFTRHSLGYAYIMGSLQYYFQKKIAISIGIEPSYLVLYKKYEDKNVYNYISGIQNKYKPDVPFTVGILGKIAPQHGAGIQFISSTKPFATQTNFNPPSVDKFFHYGITVLYTFYFSVPEEEEEEKE